MGCKYDHNWLVSTMKLQVGIGGCLQGLGLRMKFRVEGLGFCSSEESKPASHLDALAAAPAEPSSLTGLAFGRCCVFLNHHMYIYTIYIHMYIYVCLHI